MEVELAQLQSWSIGFSPPVAHTSLPVYFWTHSTREATRCARGVRAVQRHGRVEMLALFQLVVDDVTARSKAASRFLPGDAAPGKESRALGPKHLPPYPGKSKLPA